MILFTPVYHAFHRIIRANGREIVESPLVLRDDGRYAMDLDALAAALTGRERMRRALLAAQPRRPGLERATSSARSPTSAAPTTCILVADEIHHDLAVAVEDLCPGKLIPAPSIRPASA